MERDVAGRITERSLESRFGSAAAVVESKDDGMTWDQEELDRPEEDTKGKKAPWMVPDGDRRTLAARLAEQREKARLEAEAEKDHGGLRALDETDAAFLRQLRAREAEAKLAQRMRDMDQLEQVRQRLAEQRRRLRTEAHAVAAGDTEGVELPRRRFFRKTADDIVDTADQDNDKSEAQDKLQDEDKQEDGKEEPPLKRRRVLKKKKGALVAYQESDSDSDSD
ncbi:MAG: hypothetical protein MHM6MM_001754 [Cercozoa sp. M6MM]